MNERYLGSSKEDWIMVTTPMTFWLGTLADNVPNSVKNLIMYSYIITDKYLGGDGLVEVTLGELEDRNDTTFVLSLNSSELAAIMNANWENGIPGISLKPLSKHRTKKEIDSVLQTIKALGEVDFKSIIGETLVQVSFSQQVNYGLKSGDIKLYINKMFLRCMRGLTQFSKTYGYMQSLSSYALSPNALSLYSFICVNDKAIESQTIKGGIPYSGVKFRDLCDLLSLNGRIDNNKRNIEKSLGEINSKLKLNIGVRYTYSGKSLDRIIFFCEQGGVHMDRKYFKDTSKSLPRVTTELVNLFKVKYESYYGSKCKIKDDKLHYEIRQSFDVFGLDIYDVSDREWYENNVLQDLFKKYDDLGYSEGKTFGAGHLHVEWLMNNLVNNIPNKKKEDKNDLTGKVGTVAMEHQDWMDIDVSNVDDEEVF
ncbi:MAG: hypothetical protein ACI31M_02360 [Bacilli bacterium]